jgi:hypothetical protein
MVRYVTVFILKQISRVCQVCSYILNRKRWKFKGALAHLWSRIKYPQTWYWIPKAWEKTPSYEKPLYCKYPLTIAFCEWLCGKLTGHEISKTESGYGGGNFYDYHCRWCDKLIQIPTNEMPSGDWMKEAIGDS